jgi:hypothetical protein
MTEVQTGPDKRGRPAAQAFDPSTLLSRQSLTELNARERAQALLDAGTYRELLGPFDRLESPWLPMQGVVPQADDGLIVARGEISRKSSVILSIEGQFQGGSTGEVSGAKIAAVLDLARADAEKGRPIQVVLLLETGGSQAPRSQSWAGGDSGNQFIAGSPAATSAGGWSDRRNGRLLWRHVYHCLSLQLSGDDPCRPAWVERSGSDRRTVWHRRVRFERSATGLVGHGRRTTL